MGGQMDEGVDGEGDELNVVHQFLLTIETIQCH